MKNIRIEKLKVNDYNLIPDIYSDSFNDNPWEDNWYEFLDFDPKSVWIAKDGDYGIGYLISFISEGVPYISVLAIRQKYQRKGVGKKLIHKCVNYWKKSYNEITVHAENERPNSVDFYKKYGFVEAEIQEEYILMKYIIYKDTKY